MTEWGLRLRSILSDYLVVAIVAALVVAAAGGILVYTTYVEPGTETEPEIQGSWESTAEYSHSATVIEPNRVFPTGTTLEDRSLYYTRLSPELDGTFRYQFGSPDGQLDVTADSRLVLRATDDGEEFWRVEEPLTATETTLEPGDTAELEMRVNVSEVLAEFDDIESELGASPGQTEAFIRTEVSAEGNAVGGEASHADTYDMSISPGSDTYEVEADSETEQHDRVEPVTREIQHSPLRMAAGPLLLVIGLLGAIGLGTAGHQGRLDVTEQERERLVFASQRSEFDDWISRGSVSNATEGRSVVRIDNLEDLVDIAIDTDERVIEDVGKHRYYVLGESHCYEYHPPKDIDIRTLQ